MGDNRATDRGFLLEDAALEDLLSDLATNDAFYHHIPPDVGDHGGLLRSLDANLSPHTSDVSLAVDCTESTTSLAFDAADTADLSSETASQTSSDSTVKKPMVNSTRVRMQQELSYLRHKVVELEQQLETAKQHSVTELAVTITDDTNQPQEENDASLVNVQCALWERVARHQRLEKQKAERKNAELRLLLEDQLKIARSLEKALRKRPSATLSASLVDELDGSGRYSKRICGGNPQDASTFARLTERADRSYEELAAIWQRTGFDSAKTERNDAQVLVDSANRLYLEVTTAKIVPFSMQATDRAAWACISQPKLKFMNGIYHGVKATSDCIHSHSEMWMHVGAATAHMNMAIVTKRFEEKNGRVVYVLESSSIGGGSRDLLQSVQIVEKGWVVLEPVRTRTVTRLDGSPDEADVASMESTIIQVCMRLMPALTDDLMSTPGAGVPGALTDLILGVFRQNLGFLFQTIENMLVEQMLSTGDGEIKKDFVT